MAVEQDLTVVVMGATGTGKSSFVNLASGSNFPVGSGLKSCTHGVQESDPFIVRGRKMRLIDTPGFDDTTRTDTEILHTIVAYLAEEYRQSKKVSGIIYMHRISDFKMTGVAKRNFIMFRRLCGDTTLKNVAIVTNMWGEVSERDGEIRERELANDDILFKPVLDRGATMLRHHNTAASAQEILQRFLDNHPVALQAQSEVVTEGKTTDSTSAGLELRKEMDSAMEETRNLQEQELVRARERTELAAREASLRQAQEVERARLEMEARITREREAHERELARQAEERRQEETRRQDLQRMWEAEQLGHRAQEEHARRVQAEMAEKAREAEALQARMRAEVRRLQSRRRGRGADCIIC